MFKQVIRSRIILEAGKQDWQLLSSICERMNLGSARGNENGEKCGFKRRLGTESKGF